MAFTPSQRKMDCVITAISNYFGVPYAEVEKRLGRTRGGYTEKQYLPVIQHYLGRAPKTHKPRRGQERYTGLVQFKRGNMRKGAGHMACMIDGYVFEVRQPGVQDIAPEDLLLMLRTGDSTLTSATSATGEARVMVYPIARYRVLFGWRIRQLWN